MYRALLCPLPENVGQLGKSPSYPLQNLDYPNDTISLFSQSCSPYLSHAEDIQTIKGLSGLWTNLPRNIYTLLSPRIPPKIQIDGKPNLCGARIGVLLILACVHRRLAFYRFIQQLARSSVQRSKSHSYSYHDDGIATTALKNSYRSSVLR